MFDDRIPARWPTADAFYAERDDRTARVVADLHAYVTRPIEIHVDTEAANEAAVQVMALVAANLTARWARCVRVVVSARVVLAPDLQRDGMITLAERVAREMTLADPFGEFVLTDAASVRPGSDALKLFVGPWRGARLGPDDYRIAASSWTALGARGDRAGSDLCGSEATVAAAGLAGALGAADLFKRAIRSDRERWLPTFAWDTWSSQLTLGAEAWRRIEVRPVPGLLELANTLLAGVGAIGSAWVYLADMMPMQGMLTLFDRDRIEITNLNRSPMFTVLHALEAQAKTAAANAYLERRPVRVTRSDGIWREHASRLGAEPYDVWISLTNEDGAWATVPFQLPPVVLHATTTSGWGFGAGRHIPRIEDCPLCRMPRPMVEFRGPCAEGEVVRIEHESVRASLPFLSTAAAALLLASQLQLQTGAGAVDLPNDISADLGAGLPAVIGLSRGPTAACRGCRAALSPVWDRRGGRGRFAEYSRQLSQVYEAQGSLQ